MHPLGALKVNVSGVQCKAEKIATRIQENGLIMQDGIAEVRSALALASKVDLLTDKSLGLLVLGGDLGNKPVHGLLEFVKRVSKGVLLFLVCDSLESSVVYAVLL